MNDIENRINYENQMLNKLETKKEEMLYEIPHQLNEQSKKSIFLFLEIIIILTTIITVFAGWFLMDYLKPLLSALLVSNLIAGPASILDYFSKTRSQRRKLKRFDIYQLNQEMFNHKNQIKFLTQELIREKSKAINEQLKTNSNQNYATQRSVANMPFPAQDNYESGRKR